jgi:hypothetical protein
MLNDAHGEGHVPPQDVPKGWTHVHPFGMQRREVADYSEPGGVRFSASTTHSPPSAL